jgi:hypothetical protein
MISNTELIKMLFRIYGTHSKITLNFKSYFTPTHNKKLCFLRQKTNEMLQASKREREGGGRARVSQRYVGLECVLILCVFMLNITLYFP